MSVVGRLAPSPTGAQHVGNARTYLLAWLSARSRSGRLVVRIEDIDSPRIKRGAAEQALEDLHWLGLDWDGQPIVQSTRLERHLAALRRLAEQEQIYPCTCTRGDIDRAASAPHETEPVYPGTCRHRQASDSRALDSAGINYCWRFRLPALIPEFQDSFRGLCKVDLHSAGGDFVVWKTNRTIPGGSTPAYQLAVVVDDAEQGVTEVVRGDDLVSSTPRQLLVHSALDLTPPAYSHVPLVVGPDGRRLAKRHGDTRLAALRAAGVRPGALRALLAWSCGWLGEGSFPGGECSTGELLQLYQLESIPRQPFVLREEHLQAIGYRA